MAIELSCPACGKEYRVRRELAGRQVRCKCGEVMRVPRSAAAAESKGWDPFDDAEIWEASVSRPASEPAEERPTAPDEAAEGRQTHAGSASAGDEPSAAPPQREIWFPSTGYYQEKPEEWTDEDWESIRKIEAWRKTVGVLAIGYGGVMASVVLGVIVTTGSLLAPLLPLAVAVSLVAGGVLVLKRNQHGPACVGIACLAISLVTAIGLIILALFALVQGYLQVFAGLCAVVFVLYSIPAGLAYWSFKAEKMQRKLETSLR